MPAGRPPLFVQQPDLLERLCTLLDSSKKPLTLALDEVGISRQDWHNWRLRSAEEQESGEPGPYTLFVTTVMAQRSKLSDIPLNALYHVVQAGESESAVVNAAKFVLEKTFPEEFGSRGTLDINHGGQDDSFDKVLENIQRGREAIEAEDGE